MRHSSVLVKEATQSTQAERYLRAVRKWKHYSYWGGGPMEIKVERESKNRIIKSTSLLVKGLRGNFLKRHKTIVMNRMKNVYGMSPFIGKK